MSDPSHPNVVFILVDNVGWGDFGCYGGLAPTPRVDALAAQGVRVKNFNIEAQCTPTRSAILTGRLPVRTGNFTVPGPGSGHWRLFPRTPLAGTHQQAVVEVFGRVREGAENH